MQDEGYHTTIISNPATNLISSKLITGSDRSSIGPILFRGVALTSNEKNPLRLEVLTADTTAYSFNPTAKVVDEYPAAVGRSTLLVGALQARNNARVVLCGSLEAFGNAFLRAEVNRNGEWWFGISMSSWINLITGQKPVKSGNSALVTGLSKWVLKEVGVLRVNGVEHHKAGEVAPPQEYTIMEDVDYAISIEELVDGKWQPFKGSDVQLEFVRIDPFVRVTLKNDGSEFYSITVYSTQSLTNSFAEGRLSTRFRVPDTYGVFKFQVDYRRVGYTHLFDVRQVSVRPLLHTQYERFSRCAYPYYVSAASMMLGVILFSYVFLYYKEPATASTVSKPAPTAAAARSSKKSE